MRVPGLPRGLPGVRGEEHLLSELLRFDTPSVTPAPSQRPNYTLRDAAVYTKLSYWTVRYWTGGGGAKPVIKVGKLLSLVNLVELHMVGIFRHEHSISLQRVRKAVGQLAREFPEEPHPLASKTFWILGKDVLMQKLGKFVSLCTPGQLAFDEAIECAAKRVEYERGTPVRFYPWPLLNLDRIEHERRSVVIDPEVQFGNAVITGTRVPTRAIKARWDLGEMIESIAADFDVSTEQVQDAIRCETRHTG